MKKNYIIPSTESIALQAGTVCTGSGTGQNVNYNIPGLGNGGEQSGGNPD